MSHNSANIILDAETHPENSTDDYHVPQFCDEEIFFAKERYNLHQSSPEEGVDTDILKKYFTRKYGF